MKNSIVMMAHHDLTTRARGGIVMYLIVWLLLVNWAEIHLNTPYLFWLNTFLFAVICAQRALHYWLHIKNPYENVDGMYRWLIFLVLFSALHWGLMSAWLIGYSPYDQLRAPSLMIVTAFAVGGTATLSISPSIRKFYSILIFGPVIPILFIQGGSENITLSIMAILAILYVLQASATTSMDYYSAITNRNLAQQRAFRLEEIANTDSITGLPNQRMLEKKFNSIADEAERHGSKFAFFYIDIIDFKNFNDEISHDTGDLILQALAKRFVQNQHDNEYFARLGGANFCLLVTQYDDKKELEKIALRLGSENSKNLSVASLKIDLNISVGIALYPENGTSFHELRTESDLAVFYAREKLKEPFAFA